MRNTFMTGCACGVGASFWGKGTENACVPKNRVRLLGSAEEPMNLRQRSVVMHTDAGLVF